MLLAIILLFILVAGFLAYDIVCFFENYLSHYYNALLNNLYYIVCIETKKERNFKRFTPFLMMF